MSDYCAKYVRPLLDNYDERTWYETTCQFIRYDSLSYSLDKMFDGLNHRYAIDGYFRDNYYGQALHRLRLDLTGLDFMLANPFEVCLWEQQKKLKQ
jgi:hypothetical protein